MGGTVAETIRRENGEVIKMARKTGAYNWMFFTKEFCEGNFDLAIDNHIKIFTEMKEDYQKGEPYKYLMSPVYGWCEETAPIEYGLVVIDFKNKKIHSMQGYDNPGYHYVSMLANHIILNTTVEDNFDYLLKNNLLYVLNEDNKDSENNDVKDIVEYFGENFSLEILRNKLSSFFNKYKNIFGKKEDLTNLLFFPIIFNDFECIKYEETPAGTIELFKNLVNEGFSFNSQELDIWKEKINNFDVDYFLEEKDYEIEDDELIEKIIEENRNLILETIDSYQKNNKHKKNIQI